MSESSSTWSSESSYTPPSNNKPSYSSESSVQRSSQTQPSSPEQKEDKKKSLASLKKLLKGIEEFISNNLNDQEKKLFIDQFRKIIIENEKEILLCPTASFFITKFEEVDDKTLPCKDSIIRSFKEYQNQEKLKQSKLKYW